MVDKRYSEEAIKRINSILGAGHRVKPYDMTKPKDLNDALLTTVAAYCDYRHYMETLIALEDAYDESLEYCDTSAWLDLGHAPGKADPLTVEGFAALGAASDVFEKLTKRAERNCATVIKAVLSAPPLTQEFVFGRVYNIAPKDMDREIAALFDMLSESEYQHSMPGNLNNIKEVMGEVWSEYIS